MADHLRLRVYTPEQQLVDEDVGEVTAQGALGELGVLPDHAALVTALVAGPLSYVARGRTTTIDLGPGFAEVCDDVMTILAEQSASS